MVANQPSDAEWQNVTALITAGKEDEAIAMTKTLLMRIGGPAGQQSRSHVAQKVIASLFPIMERKGLLKF